MQTIRASIDLKRSRTADGSHDSTMLSKKTSPTTQSPHDYSHAYTNPPQLHSSLLLGSLQLLFWLFFHPSAWRNHIEQIDPTLRSNFTLAELDWTKWHNRAIHQLLIRGYLVLPCLAVAWPGALLMARNVPTENIFLALSLSLAFSMAFGLTIGYLVNAASGMVGTMLTVIVGGLVYIPIGKSPEISLPLIVIGGGLSLGIVGNLTSLTANAASTQSRMVRMMERLRNALGIEGISPLRKNDDKDESREWFEPNKAQRVQQQKETQTTRYMDKALSQHHSDVVQATQMSKQIEPKRTRGCASVLGIAVLVISILYTLISQIPPGRLAYLALIALLGIFVAVTFAFTYSTVARFIGSWGGSILSTTLVGIIPLILLVFLENPIQLLILGLIGIHLGLSQHWWRPLLTYPFTLAWNQWLYLMDHICPDRPRNWLAWHAAFWDEYQHLPLLGLGKHLVLVAEQNQTEGQSAVDYLTSHNRQRSATRAAQIELDAYQMENLHDIISLSHQHRGSVAGVLDGPASTLLLTFRYISQDIDAALHQGSDYNRRMALRDVEERLDRLLIELDGRSDRYAKRFTPVIASWQQLVSEHIAVLSESADIHDEIENPYIIGIPLTEQQSLFVGRTVVSAQIGHLLSDPRSPSLLLHGQRRMGKTSLLNHLGKLLCDTVVPMFVDLQGSASRATDYAGFLYNIARAMARSAYDHDQIRLPRLERESLSTDPFTGFDEWLHQAEACLHPYTALIMLDEFEALDRAISHGRYDEADVLGMLRHIIQHHPCFKILFAGSHTLEEYQRWSSYLMNVQVVHVGYLHEAEARNLIERPVPDFALCYETEASQRVLDLTRGHPFLVQLLCSEIIMRKNEQQIRHRHVATVGDVEASVSEAMSSGHFFFTDIERNQADTEGVAVLRFMAAHGENAVVDEGTLLGVVADDLENVLNRLLQRELIERVEGGYRFQVEMIRRWFG